VSDGGPLPYLCIAGSGDLVLLVNSSCDVYIWEVDHGQSEHAAVKDSSHVSGSWSKVDKHGESVTLDAASRELAVHAVFTSDPSVSFLCLLLTCVNLLLLSVWSIHCRFDDGISDIDDGGSDNFHDF